MAEETWHLARLIPTSGINGADEQERRATSALLDASVLPIVVLHWDVQVANADGTISRTVDGGLLYVESDVTRTSP